MGAPCLLASLCRSLSRLVVGGCRWWSFESEGQSHSRTAAEGGNEVRLRGAHPWWLCTLAPFRSCTVCDVISRIHPLKHAIVFSPLFPFSLSSRTDRLSLAPPHSPYACREKDRPKARKGRRRRRRCFCCCCCCS